ncbi:uncharacterized protein [Prorops nasuta]|uniref:uncharacterized protein n=1 Tax=Prorops nasuta TaxID=863751 RepID=UPI0034CED1AF
MDQNLRLAKNKENSVQSILEIYEDAEKKQHQRYISKHMKAFPELYRSDVSVHPSYTDLKNFPYHVVARRRLQRLKKQVSRQLNREIMHFIKMQKFAINGVNIDRVFSVGMAPETLIVPDFATEKERRRLHELLRDR